MRLSIFLVLLISLFPESLAYCRKPVFQIQGIRTVFVDGNNEAAIDARRKMMKSADKFQDGACFQIAINKKQAEAVLEINQHEVTGGINGSRTTVATGTLQSAQGDLLWSDSKQGVAGFIHSGAGDAVGNLLSSLYKSSGCFWNGRRKR